MKKNLALILAGGSGSRIHHEIPKQFLKLRDKTILELSIEKFENHPGIQHIFIVSHGEFLNKTEEIVHCSKYKKVVKVIKGGQSRQESSRIGVNAAQPQEYENVLIHDAARPLVSPEIISAILEKLGTYRAVNVAIPSQDTIIEIDDNSLIKSAPDRKYLRRVQTPQGFKLELIQKAHQLALEKGITHATDDCSLVLTFKLADIYVTEGSLLNIKITYPEDIIVAETLTPDHR